MNANKKSSETAVKTSKDQDAQDVFSLALARLGRKMVVVRKPSNKS